MGRDTQPVSTMITVITFTIDEQICVMSVHDLLEIIQARSLMPLPATQESRPRDAGTKTLGILDYRGRAIPVVHLSLARVEGRSAQESPGPFKSLLVLGHAGSGQDRGGGRSCALAVHRVHAVAEIDERTIQDPREVGLTARAGVSGICRLGDRLAYVIDGTHLMTAPAELAA